MVKKSSSLFEMRWFSLKWQLSHSSVFEIRWFIWFRNYHRTHQYLRWDGSVVEMRWLTIWNEINDPSIVSFESWTVMSSENWIWNPHLNKTEKKIHTSGKKYSTKSEFFFEYCWVIGTIFLFFLWLFLNPFPRNLHLRKSVCVVSMAHSGIHSQLFSLKICLLGCFGCFWILSHKNSNFVKSVSVVFMAHYGIRSLVCLMKFSPDKVYLFYWT